MGKGIQFKRDTRLKVGNRRHCPLPTGPYKIIGCRDIMTGSSKLTGLLVRIYYPAWNQDRDIRDSYLVWPNWFPNDNYRHGYANVSGLRRNCVKNAVNWMIGDCFIPCLPNAKPLRQNGGHPWPVIVFSHGLGGCRTTYSSLCLEFASHGFVVAAIEHRDGSSCCTFYAKDVKLSMYGSSMRLSQADLLNEESDHEDEGFMVRSKSSQRLTFLPQVTMDWIDYKVVKNDENQYGTRNKQMYQRVRECSRALDLFDSLNRGYEIQNLMDQLLDPTEFQGILDLDRASVIGHSMGAATALLALTSELRFKAGICLDPWMYPIRKECFDAITQPVLLVNTDKFHTRANLRKIKELFEMSNNNRRGSNTEESQKELVTIKNTVHYNQSDIPFVLPWLPRKLFGASSSRSRFTALDLTTTLSLDFLSHHLEVGLNEDPRCRREVYLNLQKKKLKYGLPTKI